MPVRMTPPPLGAFLMVVIVYPVLEEFVFREALQGALLIRPPFAASLAGISLASVVTSTLFALAHLAQQPPVWAAMVFLPSLIFGWAKERHGTLASPIALHMVYNAGFIGLFQTL